MSNLSPTSTQYLLLAALLHDANRMLVRYSLPRDMKVLVAKEEEPNPRFSWSNDNDVSNTATTVIRCMRKAGIEVILPEEDENFVLDRVQAITDLFALTEATRDFVEILWTNSEVAQQNQINDLMKAVLVAARHSRHRLRGDRGRAFTGYTISV